MGGGWDRAIGQDAVQRAIEDHHYPFPGSRNPKNSDVAVCNGLVYCFTRRGIFLLGRTQGHTPDEELTDAWTRLEANALGDLVRLPFKDDNPAGVSKFLAGLRWVRRRCPSARYVVKMDDSMMVEPTMFRSYLNTRVGSRRRVLHCRIKEPARLTRRDGEPSVNPSEEHFPRTFYFR
ncbi:hypothetical protein HPB48_026542 [Haemaphysalis longicornis]|uniref:Hexosyltransferase n=1 Tax=Haemaphysalis longicornis TaxID=44386 RepID=A0A9J6H9S2_HAELO|nr:hypothetical protein HPB48_026542 [Haemaphysalis longicornis]